MGNEETYKNRDRILGNIEAKVDRIPELERKVDQSNLDINKLDSRMAVLEVKSGLLGIIGGAIVIAGFKIKTFFGAM